LEFIKCGGIFKAVKRLGVIVFRNKFFLRVAVFQILAAGILGFISVSPIQAGSLALEQGQLKGMGFLLFDDREQAPVLKAPLLSGGTLSLTSYRGKWILLNFWATWCLPCRTEIPTLNRLNERMKGHPFVLISVAMDYKPGQIRTFIHKIPVAYPILLGRKGEIDDRYFGMGLPETYLIDPNGVLIGKVTGARNWASSEALALFGSLEAAGPGGPLVHTKKGSS
ncbi:MAG: TlpA family protein disulfide reductase, partial [Leptospirales bacterium]